MASLLSCPSLSWRSALGLVPGLPVRRLAIHAAVPDGLAAAALLGSLGDAAVGEGFGRRRIGGGYSAAAAGLVPLGRRGGGCCLLLPSNGLHLLDATDLALDNFF